MNYVLLASLAVLAGLAYAQTAHAEPVLHDAGLVYDEYVTGLCCGVTTMEFMDDGTLLILQKDGQVRVFQDGALREEPAVVVDTRKFREAGLLGITSVGTSVYLYHTAPVHDRTADGNVLDELLGGEDPEIPRGIVNRIYKYTWDGNSLVDPVLIKELPANWYHNSGVMISDQDGQVYAVIGDTGRYGPLQNKNPDEVYPPGITDYMDTSVIMRADPPGPYYAVGIRNSFGVAFDPVTGSMWDTENGDDDFDEINMVPDGFNSGWIDIMGPATGKDLERFTGYEGYEYQDPKFSWKRTVAPAAIGFASFEETDEYNSSVFVGDCNFSRLYKFQLNDERDGFVFASPGLRDLVLDEGDPLDEILVGTGFRCITDIKTGPDGYLYLASHIDGAVYRIMPAAAEPQDEPGMPARDDGRDSVQEPGGGCLIATAAYGTELAPQVQMLREIRDDVLRPTASGTAFLSGFNQVYYSFSPAVADLERENPALREATRHLITPMLYSISLMALAEDGSEAHAAGLGILVIALNVGMYVAAPAAALWHVGRRVGAFRRAGGLAART